MTVPGGRLTILDYGAGNVRSLTNALAHLGYTDIKMVASPEDIHQADKLIFPGVGQFSLAISRLRSMGVIDALKAYVQANRPFLGICVGHQVLFESSDEAPETPGLGLVPGHVTRFDATSGGGKSVPHMGWNAVHVPHAPAVPDLINTRGAASRYYFVHSYAARATAQNAAWVGGMARYEDEIFIAYVRHGNVFGTQFHPEKSGPDGLQLLAQFLAYQPVPELDAGLPAVTLADIDRMAIEHRLGKRILACLDVRENDAGDLVVTKGDQYQVRAAGDRADVRNLGKPVQLAQEYYRSGADEIVFLNITAFRHCPLRDLPMLAVLEEASKHIFVPLTVGGGIKDVAATAEQTGMTALEVAGAYFRAGCDKVAIGSDAVDAAMRYLQHGKNPAAPTAIEQIAGAYGVQAVVISVDAKRHFLAAADAVPNGHAVVALQHTRGPNGEAFAWYQCSVKGGREFRDLDVQQLLVACQALGAGEIMLNCIDHDGQNAGYDLDLLRAARQSVSIPIIASSGAGAPQHFIDAFQKSQSDAALAAGIFHRKEVSINDVKAAVQQAGYETRIFRPDDLL
ncbi:hypothetical protein CXG81DRAFT_9030 [Caulochytrium protostelioides]|uniref:Imidazole glycerol phosphate synthase hisHF n=1 Tax=Caulochytrium protostelioides TaxID=1555241 RepID=A0A4P9XE92_9FUNG|nr:hypothetical protein CXG81DRAFT_9030 [Caulochytrium protostelioides]|eukprot:RKP03843.1 hypothetical protein CXG81DRAFT_9030 [Caulochytrium protostelioides]